MIKTVKIHSSRIEELLRNVKDNCSNSEKSANNQTIEHGYVYFNRIRINIFPSSDSMLLVKLESEESDQEYMESLMANFSKYAEEKRQ